MFERETRSVEMAVRGAELLDLPRVEVSFGPMRTDTHVLGEYGWVLRMHQRTPLHVRETRPKVSLTPGDTRDFGFRWKLRARRPYRNEQEVLDDISGVKAQKFSLSKYETKYVHVGGMTAEQEKQLAALRFDRETLQRELSATRLDLAEARRRMVESEKFAQRLIDSDAYTPSVDAYVDQAMTDHRKYLTEVMAQLSEALAVIEKYEGDPFALLQKWNEEKISGMSFERKPEAAPVPPENVIDLLEHLQARTAPDDAVVARAEELLKRLA